MIDHKNLATIYNCNFDRFSQLSEEIQFGMPCHHGAQLSAFLFHGRKGRLCVNVRAPRRSSTIVEEVFSEAPESLPSLLAGLVGWRCPLWRFLSFLGI